MKKSILLLVLICISLSLIPSCRKKSDSENNKGIVESLISSEAKSTIEPVVVVPEPESLKKREEDREEETLSTSEEAVFASSVIEDVAYVEEETEEKSFVDMTIVSFDEPVAEEETALPYSEEEEKPQEEETQALKDEEIVVLTEVVEEKEEEEEEVIDPFFTFTYAYGGYSSDIVIASTYTTLTVPEVVSLEDIDAVALMAVNAYPVEASLVTYYVKDGTVTLNYPEQTKDYLYSLLPLIEKEAQYVLDMYPLSRDEKAEEEVITLPEETLSPIESVDEAEVEEISPLAVTEEVTAVVEERKSLIQSWSISAYVEPKFNLNGGWQNPFVAAFGVRGEAQLTSTLSAGIKAQYDMSAYIESSLYAKWTFAELGDFDLYIKGGLGVTFGLGQNINQSSLLIDAALGLEYGISERLSLFGEITADWSVTKPGFELGAALGVRYTF